MKAHPKTANGTSDLQFSKSEAFDSWFAVEKIHFFESSFEVVRRKLLLSTEVISIKF